ncbi:universal stress protein [Tamlana sp. 2_MG-2023]|uniref:universal stress protein n=1 Tax=unclassified Tamlana TaxID=2614803 RepID=UPI0026E1D8BE|nr:MULTISPECIES: universal stress protein [unclassified Tamlana]MDO6761057.1 universal stress protein [Tamlana sp. 2_MG-2023]MDO6791610.1 universal stress protein [Tamlana sp. 1_MG-2023]
MNKILVPTDFSEQAENALKVATQLAKKHNCEIHLLHILDLPMHQIDPVNATSFSSGPEALFFMKLAKKRFDDLLNKDYLKGLTVFSTVDFHEIYSGISDQCEKHDIDLIVMGSNGSSGIEEILIGSNTEKVVRNSEVPVLVIKKEHENFEINNFVFASDFTEENQSAYKKALKFTELWQAKMHLLLVNTPNKFVTTKEANARIEKFTSTLKPGNQTVNIYNDDTIEKGIINFSYAIDADLIGMSTHGRKGISNFFNGSISEDLVNHANRPVLTFKL